MWNEQWLERVLEYEAKSLSNNVLLKEWMGVGRDQKRTYVITQQTG